MGNDAGCCGIGWRGQSWRVGLRVCVASTGGGGTNKAHSRQQAGGEGALFGQPWMCMGWVSRCHSGCGKRVRQNLPDLSLHRASGPVTYPAVVALGGRGAGAGAVVIGGRRLAAVAWLGELGLGSCGRGRFKASPRRHGEDIYAASWACSSGGGGSRSYLHTMKGRLTTPPPIPHCGPLQARLA